jgi:predicted RNA-binding Zn-ribbon protein involved in translation (DUF1610 family)
MPETMRLLKCPACGGPLDPPAGESTMKCPYCTNQVIVPESLRISKKEAGSHVSVFSGIDMGSMMGYGAQWSEVVQLAQTGQKDEAVKKYMKLTGNTESSARYMVDTLAGYQSYEFNPGSYNSVHQIYAPIMAQTGETIKTVTKFSLWLGLGITAFVFCIILITVIPILIGVFASLWAAF